MADSDGGIISILQIQWLDHTKLQIHSSVVIAYAIETMYFTKISTVSCRKIEFELFFQLFEDNEPKWMLISFSIRSINLKTNKNKIANKFKKILFQNRKNERKKEKDCTFKSITNKFYKCLNTKSK